VDYVIYLGTLMAIYTTLTVSLNLLVGYTGLLSIAQAGLYGVGAYIAALVAMNISTSVLLVLALAAIGGAVVSLAVALPALRLRNEYFLIATMGFQIILYSSFMNLDITGGPVGLYGIPYAQLFGYTIKSSVQLFVLAVALAAVCFFLAWRAAHSPFGRALKAVREDQIAVASLGKSVFRFKVSIFVFAAMFASAAGTVYAFSLTTIDPFAFTMDESIFIITLVIIGGTGNLAGSVLAPVLLIALPESFKFLAIPETVAAQLRQILYGLLLVLFTRFRRQGLIGEYKDVLQ
jgi:branched-chain amino acid transport system permease protein